MTFDGKPHKAEYSDVKDNNHIIFLLMIKDWSFLVRYLGTRQVGTSLQANRRGDDCMQMSDMLGIKLNLVLYHLNKMMELQIISVVRTTKTAGATK